MIKRPLTYTVSMILLVCSALAVERAFEDGLWWIGPMGLFIAGFGMYASFQDLPK